MSLEVSKDTRRLSAAAHAIGDSVASRQALTKLPIVFGYMAAIEFVTVATSTYFASTLYHQFSFGTIPSAKEYVNEALFIATMFTVVSLGFRHFGIAQRRQLHMLLWSGIGAAILAFGAFLSTIFLLKISVDYSRGAFISQLFSVSISVCIFRTIFLLWLQSAVGSGAIEARRAVLIGDADSTIAHELRAEGIHVVKSFPLPHRIENELGVTFDGTRTFTSNSSIRTMMDLCRTVLPDDILIFSGQKDLPFASELARCFSEIPCNIHIAPRDEIRFLTRSQIAEWGSIKTLQISRRPLSYFELAIKRAFDIVVATGALIALSPLLAVVALAIKLDSSGNVFFRQKRHGYNNKIIWVLKFRTMAPAKGDLGFSPTIENDSRVTIIGQILRKTSIDELPQLLNVLFGEMSIVGPRPHATDHNKLFEDQILPFARRHNVKPGITGWAQVNGYRGPADTVEKMRRRVEHDLYYIDNWSFFFDLKIMLMTLFSKRAYKNAF
jgi:Undecaprenyl-phosphate glucose phosphotransferase